MAVSQTPLTGSPIPMPGIYREKQAQAQKAYQTSLAAINQRRQAMLTQYGMTGDVDAQGAYSNYRIDPNSQYGDLQTMKQTQGMALNEAYNQADDRGLGHVGLGAQGESLLKYGQGADSQALGQDFVHGMGDLAQLQTQNQDTLSQQMYQAEADARQEAIQNQWFTQTPYGDDGSGGMSGAAGSGGDHGLQWPGLAHQNLAAAGYSDEEVANAIYKTMAERGWGQYTVGNGGPEDPQVHDDGQVHHDSGGDYIWVKVGYADGRPSTEKIYLPPPQSRAAPTPTPRTTEQAVAAAAARRTLTPQPTTTATTPQSARQVLAQILAAKGRE